MPPTLLEGSTTIGRNRSRSLVCLNFSLSHVYYVIVAFLNLFCIKTPFPDPIQVFWDRSAQAEQLACHPFGRRQAMAPPLGSPSPKAERIWGLRRAVSKERCRSRSRSIPDRPEPRFLVEAAA